MRTTNSRNNDSDGNLQNILSEIIIQKKTIRLEKYQYHFV